MRSLRVARVTGVARPAIIPGTVVRALTYGLQTPKDERPRQMPEGIVDVWV